jgi:hypothetical protein
MEVLVKRAVLWCFVALAPVLTLGSVVSASAAQATVAAAASGSFRAITFPGAAVTQPNNINDNGVIVGCYQNTRGPLRGFIDRAGRFSTVNDPAAGRNAPVTACLLGVNKRGTVDGFYVSSTGVQHGFVDRGGRFTTINAPGAGRLAGEGTEATTINDSGAIGGLYIDSRRVLHGFVLAGGRFRFVNDPHAGKAVSQGTYVTGISDSGLVVGTYVDSRNVQHGFEDQAGRFTTIDHANAAQRPRKGTFVGCVSLQTRELTGTYFLASGPGIGFAGQVGHFRTISDPAATAGTGPSCANDSGRIVGDYSTVGGVLHGFEFIP